MSIRKHGDILAGQNSINIKTDAELSRVSENPIQNRAVTNALDEKLDINQDVVTVNTNSITVEPGKAYKWNVNGNGTLTFEGEADKYETIPIYINLAEGSSVTASGVTIPHEINSSGWYEIKWDGTNGTLEKSDSGNASDIEDSTKHQSVQETLDELENEKVGKPETFTEGNLMGFDENGDAKDSEIDPDKLVVHPGSYDDLTVGLAENLTDPRAPSTNRKFGFDTACGDISISDDGTATPTLLKGTTYVKNQLVGDSKVIKETGQGVVNGPYSVSGDIDHAYIKGRSLVKNQLVPASSIWYLQPSLTMVINNSTVTATDGKVVVAGTNDGNFESRFWLNFTDSNGVDMIAGHTYALFGSMSVTGVSLIPYVNIYSASGDNRNLTSAQTLNTSPFVTFTLSYSGPHQIRMYTKNNPNTVFSPGWKVEVELYLVDLTMLYNGVTSLVNNITSRAALVADTGMYGSYTAYDVGSVVHSDQTELRVTGKNLFDKNAWQTIVFNFIRPSYNNGDNKLVNGCFLKAGTTVTLSLDTANSTRHNYIYLCARINGFDYDLTDCAIITSNYITTTSWTTLPRSFTMTKDAYVFMYCALDNDNFASAEAANEALKDLQIELGSTATAYEPYYSGGTATAGLLKGVPGSVYDQLDAITGNVTTRIGSYTFTGNETWTALGSAGRYYANGVINDAYRISNTANIMTYMMAGYTPLATIADSSPDYTVELNSTRTNIQNQVMIKDSTCINASALAAKLAGKTIYYRLKTYTKSTTTPQPLTQPTGTLTVLQTAGTLPIPLDVRHAVSEWDEPIVRNCKYIWRNSEGTDSLVTGSTTVTSKHVVGGVDKLINLTQWFGRNREPSVADFYKLFPTWKGADIPYDRGTILNYKGTGVRTIGFNAYNNATGTAVLLGDNQYQICGTYTSCTYTDQWGNAEELDIDSSGIFTPVNNGTLTVVGGNDTDTCVHLCWSGYKNYGEPDYEWFPYEEKGVEWDLLQWFPNGMNGAGVDWFQDTITNNKAHIGTGYLVLNGSEDWKIYSNTSGRRGFYVTNVLSYGFDYDSNVSSLCGVAIAETASGNALSISDWAESLWCGVSVTKNLYLVWSSSTVGSIPTDIQSLCWDQETDTLDEDAFKEYLSEHPLTIFYSLKEKSRDYTQDIEVTPTQNFSYPVNDFGTEQSLPVNTLTLLTTDLDADIRYSLDFTRTVAHYSEIENDVKQLVEEKDNLARQDGNYGDKGGVFNYATQLLDPNAQPVEASYGNRTAAGDVSIADNGTADMTSLQGTTQIQNQLVHDTNMNTKSSTDGKLVVTDAVGGDVTKLLLKGGCVVHNQLVQDSIEKTATGTGRLGVEDGVAGNAKGLVMTAPRSVVMNQQLRATNTTYWQQYNPPENLSTITSSNDELTFTLIAKPEDTTVASWKGGIVLKDNYKNTLNNTHVYVVAFEVKSSNTAWQTFRLETGLRSENNSTAMSLVVPINLPSANTWVRGFSRGVPYSTTASGIIYPFNNNGTGTWSTWNIGDTYSIRNYMIVDLTAYFNGNTTLINSINSWDDLVAYDSTFASYVPYNTGVVQGVQPTVKVNHTTDVACPVELFGADDTVDTFDGVGGVVTRKMASVDMGTLTWQYNATYDCFYAYLNQNALSHGNMICAKYVNVGSFNNLADKTLAYIFTRTVAVRDAAYNNDASAFTTAMSGVYLYYELATPTTTQYTPTTIPTLDIYNTALQIVGTRQCGLSLTYDGKDQTIALNPSHTYVFNDNQEDDSVITGQSSIEAVGGEDQLVDITQLYNGDATKIAAIHSYASLSSRFHRYRNLLPYNPGTVEPEVQTVKVYPNEHAYGILYDPNQNTPNCQKVELINGNLIEVNEFTSMPCHQLHRCVMSNLSSRTIAYYLDDEDSNKKYNGTRNGVTSDGSASVLTGSDGDVMVEIPISYWSVDEDHNGTGKVLWLISDAPFTNSSIHDFFYVSPDGATPRVQYVGAYRASICNADGTPINTTEGALSQSTGTAGTNIARSIAGSLPYVSVSQADLLTRAVRNGGSTVNTKFHQWLMLLMIIEQGSLNTQSISAGYSGGIQNAYCFWRKSGRVNAGNGTGQILADLNSQDMDNFQKFTVGSTVVQRDTLMDADGRYAWSIYNRNASSTRYFTNSPTPSNGDVVYSASTGTSTAGTVASYTLNGTRVVQFQYRGIENPFGEVWEFEHGIQKYSHGILASIKVNNVIYTRDAEKDGASSRAWTNNSTTVWTALSITSTSHAYNDPELTNDTGYVASSNGYVYGKLGYWETLSTNDYTSTEQATAINPSYTWKNHRWPMANGYVKKFNPRTFFNLVNGGSTSTYMCDYYYDQAGSGSRVVYRGGAAYYGSSDGLGAVGGRFGLGSANVSISGRLSA